MSGMVDVLVAHQRHISRSCLCGWDALGKSHPEHQEAMLTVAGFGPVAEVAPPEVRAAKARAQGDGEALTAAIHTRRRRKCIAAGEHQPQQPDVPEPAKCPRCGL